MGWKHWSESLEKSGSMFLENSWLRQQQAKDQEKQWTKDLAIDTSTATKSQNPQPLQQLQSGQRTSKFRSSGIAARMVFTTTSSAESTVLWTQKTGPQIESTCQHSLKNMCHLWVVNVLYPLAFKFLLRDIRRRGRNILCKLPDSGIKTL